MASFIYNRAKKEIADGTIDLLNDTIKVMLVKSTYVADADHDFVDEAGANDPIDEELSGTGYDPGFAGSGRKTLASKVISEDDAANRAEFDAADLVWASIDAGTAAGMIIYKHITNDTLSTLIAYIDSGGFPKTTNGGDLNVTVDPEGLLHW